MPTDTKQATWEHSANVYSRALRGTITDEVAESEHDDVGVATKGDLTRLGRLLPERTPMYSHFTSLHWKPVDWAFVQGVNRRCTHRRLSELLEGIETKIWLTHHEPAHEYEQEEIELWRGSFRGTFSEWIEERARERSGALYAQMTSLLTCYRSRWAHSSPFVSANDIDADQFVARKSRLKAKWPKWGTSEPNGDETSAIRDSTVALTSLDWIRSPEQIIARLQRSEPHSEERITAVLFAETTRFPKDLRAPLLGALLQFIQEKRFATDEETITAVGSAIRKFAMNMRESDFERYAELFLPSSTAAMSCEVELELAKGVTWRTLYGPFDTTTAAPQLCSRLVGLARDYAKPRLLLQKNYAAIVLDATMAAVLLGAPNARELLNEISNLNVDWFDAMLFRRINQEASTLRPDQSELRRRLTDALPAAE